MKQLIYLDNSATTQIRSEVLQAMKAIPERVFWQRFFHSPLGAPFSCGD